MSMVACSPLALALALSVAFWACLISDTSSACKAESVGLAPAVVTLDFLVDFLVLRELDRISCCYERSLEL